MKRSFGYFFCGLMLLLNLHSSGQLMIRIEPPVDMKGFILDDSCIIQLINTSDETHCIVLEMKLSLDTLNVLYQQRSGNLMINAGFDSTFQWAGIISLPKNQDTIIRDTSLSERLYDLCLEAMECRTRKKIGEDCLRFILGL